MTGQSKSPSLTRRQAVTLIAGAPGEELLSVSIDDPRNFTYRCVCYE